MEDLEEGYKEIELCLKRAQEELGQALCNLTSDTVPSGQQGSDDQDLLHSDICPDLTSGFGYFPDRSLDRSYNSLHKQKRKKPTPSVDFLAIFAQHDLLTDHFNPELYSGCRSPDDGLWSQTLPTFRKKPERPQTLTPPATLQPRHRFRKDDWRAYVIDDVPAKAKLDREDWRPVPNDVTRKQNVRRVERIFCMPDDVTDPHNQSIPRMENVTQTSYKYVPDYDNNLIINNLNKADKYVDYNKNMELGSVMFEKHVKSPDDVTMVDKLDVDYNRGEQLKRRISSSEAEEPSHVGIDSQNKQNDIGCMKFPAVILPDECVPDDRNNSENFDDKTTSAKTIANIASFPKDFLVPESLPSVQQNTHAQSNIEAATTEPADSLLSGKVIPCPSAQLPSSCDQDSCQPPTSPNVNKHEIRVKSRDKSKNEDERKFKKKKRSKSREKREKLINAERDGRACACDVCIGASSHISEISSSLDKAEGVVTKCIPPFCVPKKGKSTSKSAPRKVVPDRAPNYPDLLPMNQTAQPDICANNNRDMGVAVKCEKCTEMRADQPKHDSSSSQLSKINKHKKRDKCPQSSSAAGTQTDKSSSGGGGVQGSEYYGDYSSAVVIPSREQRRVWVKPQMPVIVEDAIRSGSESDVTECSSSRDSSLRGRRHHRSASSSGASVSEEQRSPGGMSVRSNSSRASSSSLAHASQTPSVRDSSSPSRDTPTSLLDSLHRKYYPDHYKGRTKSANALLESEVTVSSLPSPITSSNVPHSKSESFASENKPARVTPDRLSDSGVHDNVDATSATSAFVSPTPLAKDNFISSDAKTSSLPRRKEKDNSSKDESSERARTLPKQEHETCEDLLQEDIVRKSQELTQQQFLKALQAFRSEKELAEIEAAEACDWLRAAGFPQYAQMYEDQQFPLDIGSVQNDHDFLDPDSVQSLFRRLNTLNKCATMKIEAPPRKTADDSDEEDQCALSDKWRYQRSSRRWSRKDLDLLPQVGEDETAEKLGIRSSSSHDSVLTDNDESFSQHDDSPVLHSKSDHKDFELQLTDLTLDGRLVAPSGNHLSPGYGPLSDSESNSTASPRSPSLRRGASERFKSAKNFLKRIESLKDKKHKKARLPVSGKFDISGPVLVDTAAHQERMNRLGCVDIEPLPEVSPDGSRRSSTQRRNSEESTDSTESQKRNGNVFLDWGGSDEPPSPLVAKKRNRSSSDIVELYTVEPDHKPGTFPKLISNGYVDMGRGRQLNCRTGSINFGNENKEFNTVVLRRTQTPQDNVSSALESCLDRHRDSIYDNVPNSPDSDPQKELDLILRNLLSNISDLNESLGADYRDNLKSTESQPGEFEPSAEHDVTVDNESKQEVVDTPLDSDLTNQTECDKSSTTSQVVFKVAEVNVEECFELDEFTHNAEGLGNGTEDSVEDASAELDVCINSRKTSNGTEGGSSVSSGSTTHSAGVAGCDSPKSRQSRDSTILSEEHETGSHHERDNEVASRSGSLSNNDTSEGELPGSQEDDGIECPEMRERRDSGVGSSLTRAPSDRRRHRIRWHSFVKSHRPSLSSRDLQISSMSAGQLMLLSKLCLLKVTALMEKYSPSNRSGWNWIMPKFIKRFKAPDYKGKRVFGLPLWVIQQRTGQPLPQCILFAMRCLRRNAKDAVGIFRKSGVRSRIQKLRNQIEDDPDSVDFESLQSYDVADLLKLYFRELPECLLTNKLSETFISIFTHVPDEERLEALQAVVMLLPDENREVLQSLLLFLGDMAEHYGENQMTASNLAVCFAPSLFHMCGSRVNPGASPRRSRKNIGIPDPKELMEQKAAHECLTKMILASKKMFMIPDDLLGRCRFSYIEKGDPVTLEELGSRREDCKSSTYSAYMESCIQGLLKESRDKFKGWVTFSAGPNNTDLAYKKVGDGHPLRLWKCCVDVEAPPAEVLNRVLRERHMWDEDLMKWRIVEKLGKHTDIYQYVLNSMAPHASRDICELRSWRTDLGKGACVLVSTSVEHHEAPLLGGVRSVVLASRYLIEPCGSGKSRLTHICRIDVRGHTPEWYNKVYGHICANNIARIRDSFKQSIASTQGPETRI